MFPQPMSRRRNGKLNVNLILAPALALFCLLVATVANAGYVFTTVDYPGATTTDVRGINNSGEIVGYANDSSGTFGFKYSGGVFSRLPSAPGYVRIIASGINDSGVIVGQAHTPTSVVGFIFDGKTYTFFAYPGMDHTFPGAIGNDGRVTGYATDRNSVNRGFIYDPSTASFTDIIVPGAYFVIAQGINNAGQVVGSSRSLAGRQAFLRDPGTGALTMFQIDGRATAARDISNTGLITGFHTDPAGRQAAFVGNSTGYQLLYANATDNTYGEAINDSGQISGVYQGPPDYSGHGFIATPAALPTGTTAGGAYVFGVDVIANTPIFIDPEAAVGYLYRIGYGDPTFVTVRLPIGIGDSRYTLIVRGRKFPLAGGELFDFREHGFSRGVHGFWVTDIEVDAALDPSNPSAFPTQVSFGANGRFTGTMTPLCERESRSKWLDHERRYRGLHRCRPDGAERGRR